MIYTCNKCNFIFERVGETDICPYCENAAVREATEAEKEKFAETRAELSINTEKEDAY